MWHTKHGLGMWHTNHGSGMWHTKHGSGMWASACDAAMMVMLPGHGTQEEPVPVAGKAVRQPIPLRPGHQMVELASPHLNPSGPIPRTSGPWPRTHPIPPNSDPKPKPAALDPKESQRPALQPAGPKTQTRYPSAVT